ncbi:glutathione S-transferase N-terminal domain-containing protein [Pseudorhodobacter wandonensis]|uniref:glutathione S-transferase N-terminal domain-containing protein n=1 Tax=Pseudorhodobacter wandonensis TaxID=1120568 RepID=UPI00067CF6E5|nr:glutathione S-transferase N-terminal domain-containing protein [Pseudorhodobacter wandonensis]
MTPILYSFRRCPYAMRARLAVAVSGVPVDLREILLRDKPAAFLAASPSGTVPCLVSEQGVIDESLDVMVWALRQNDPEAWLEMPDAGWDWIARGDGPFKRALDRVKYDSRYDAAEVEAARAEAVRFFEDLDVALRAGTGEWIFARASLADYALLPFVRQFAFIDKAWFDAQDWPHVQAWLERFLASDRFAAVMVKHPVWQA